MKDIKKIVKDVIDKFQTTNLKYICDALNIHIRYDYLNPINGYFTNFNNVKVITLDYDLDSMQKDIVLAHEVGHAIMHKGFSHTFFHRVTIHNTDIIENEADRFCVYFILEKYKDDLEYASTYQEISCITGLDIKLLQKHI